MSDYRDKMNLVVFAPLQHAEPWKIGTYRKADGYTAWEKIIREKPPREEAGPR